MNSLPLMDVAARSTTPSHRAAGTARGAAIDLVFDDVFDVALERVGSRPDTPANMNDRARDPFDGQRPAGHDLRSEEHRRGSDAATGQVDPHDDELRPRSETRSEHNSERAVEREERSEPTNGRRDDTISDDTSNDKFDDKANGTSDKANGTSDKANGPSDKANGTSDAADNAAPTTDVEHTARDHEPGISAHDRAPAANSASTTSVAATLAAGAPAVGIHGSSSAAADAPATPATPTTPSPTVAAGAAVTAPAVSDPTLTAAAAADPALAEIETAPATSPAQRAVGQSANGANATLAADTTITVETGASDQVGPTPSTTPSTTSSTTPGTTSGTTPAATPGTTPVANAGADDSPVADSAATPTAAASTTAAGDETAAQTGSGDSNAGAQHDQPTAADLPDAAATPDSVAADPVDHQPDVKPTTTAPTTAPKGDTGTTVRVEATGIAAARTAAVTDRATGAPMPMPSAWAQAGDDGPDLLARAELNRLAHSGAKLGVDLSTSELGSVRVEASHRAGQLHVDLLSDLSRTRSLLSNHVDELRNDLRADGLDLGSVDVRSGNGSDRGASSQRDSNAAPGGANGPSPERATPARASTSTTASRAHQAQDSNDRGVDVRL